MLFCVRKRKRNLCVVTPQENMAVPQSSKNCVLSQDEFIPFQSLAITRVTLHLLSLCDMNVLQWVFMDCKPVKCVRVSMAKQIDVGKLALFRLQ